MVYFMLKVLFGLSMSETVFEKEGILEEVCGTPRATVLRLQHPRHGHVFLLQVRQQILVGRVPESDCVFVGCFFRGDSSPFPAEIAAEEQVRGGVVQVVLLLHRLAVARLHRLLRQVGL